ncbi:hypothetical protein KC19_3G244700 [Ceratodon purpureus]|uniref:EF-hand domain-containing protein n=1 Tax=Ceratodon purpureus TaxID=3225 RepID=A0A8T0IP17_CERPU|nr:hypothetical protein KC19_3G244700 [Ceratodon purpureus]
MKIDQMRVNPFAFRIGMVFSEDGSGRLTFQKFLTIISTFSRHTSSELKTIWIFALWDFDGDDVIDFNDIMRGIGLITSAGVISHPSKKILERPPSSEGLDEYELRDIADKVTYESDPKKVGLSYTDFRGLLLRMPDLVANFNIFVL